MPYAAHPYAAASSFQPIELVRAGWPGWTAGLGAGVLVVCDPETVYRPRHPERTVFYKVLEQHFDRYVYAYEERFEPRSGPLRAVVRPTVEAFLGCARLEGGFARIRCDSCAAEHLLAYSCRSRNFCPSCQAKRAALFAEKLVEEVLEKVPHRHHVFTIPRALRASSSGTGVCWACCRAPPTMPS